jgi:hypothetical protein
MHDLARRGDLESPLRALMRLQLDFVAHWALPLVPRHPCGPCSGP